jgi:hypothetical protein
LEAGARSGVSHERAGLPARADGEQDAEDDRTEGEGQRQEEHGQDHERDREPADHRHSPFAFNISPAAPAVNKKGSNLNFSILPGLQATGTMPAWPKSGKVEV